MTIIINISIIVVVISMVVVLLKRQPPPAGLVTDRNTTIRQVNRAGDVRPGTPDTPDAAEAARDRQQRREFIRRAEKRCNCVGFTFGRGLWEIDTEEVSTILRDNYHRVVETPARVCDIIVYGAAGGTYDHVGLVVEVSPAGVPVKIRSKATISPFIYDHPPDVAPYGNDYEIHERNSTAGLTAAAQAEITAAQAVYDAVADKTSRAAHDAAADLCQKKNILTGA